MSECTFLTILFVFKLSVVLKITPTYEVLLVKPLAQQVLQCEVTTSRQDAKLSWESPSSLFFQAESKTSVVNTSLYLMSTTITIDKFEPRHNGNYSCVFKDGTYEKRAYIHLKTVTGT